VGYFTASRAAPKVYVICAAAVALLGTVVNTSSMWVAADLTVGVMTVINVVVLIVMRREIAKLSPYGRG
jgi:Na+/alanine symporter